VAAGARIDDTGADRRIGCDVAGTVAPAEALRRQELPLEELPAAPHRAERIALNDEYG
jgi:hypothetical protein